MEEDENQEDIMHANTIRLYHITTKNEAKKARQKATKITMKVVKDNINIVDKNNIVKDDNKVMKNYNNITNINIVVKDNVTFSRLSRRS